MPNRNQHFRLAPQKRQAEMNVLPIEKQIQIVSALVEGNSVRATARMIGVEHKTVLRVLLRVGDKCGQLLNERMRKLPCKIVQVDEIWSYVGKHERFLRPHDNPVEMGDQWVFVAMDSESKLIPWLKELLGQIPLKKLTRYDVTNLFFDLIAMFYTWKFLGGVTTELVAASTWLVVVILCLTCFFWASKV
jgi:hypothetical protein